MENQKKALYFTLLPHFFLSSIDRFGPGADS